MNVICNTDYRARSVVVSCIQKYEKLKYVRYVTWLCKCLKSLQSELTCCKWARKRVKLYWNWMSRNLSLMDRRTVWLVTYVPTSFDYFRIALIKWLTVSHIYVLCTGRKRTPACLFIQNQWKAKYLKWAISVWVKKFCRLYQTIWIMSFYSYFTIVLSMSLVLVFAHDAV